MGQKAKTGVVVLGETLFGNHLQQKDSKQLTGKGGERYILCINRRRTGITRPVLEKIDSETKNVYYSLRITKFQLTRKTHAFQVSVCTLIKKSHIM